MSKGSFTNYVDKNLTTFDNPTTSGGHSFEPLPSYEHMGNLKLLKVIQNKFTFKKLGVLNT